MTGTQEREKLETLLRFYWIPEEICPSLCTVGKPPIRSAEGLLKQKRTSVRKQEERGRAMKMGYNGE